MSNVRNALVLALGLLLVAASTVPALAQNAAQDEATFREFQQIVSDFSTGERIQAWEAFLQKYPSSTFVPKVKDIIAELRGEKRPAAASTSSLGSGGDPDLDFLDDPVPTPLAVRPTPRPMATPRPIATPTPQMSNPFMDAGTGRPRTNTASADGFSWGDSGASDTGKPKPPREVAPRIPRDNRPPRAMHGVGKASHTEVAVVAALAPTEDYVRNTLFGVTATQRFGRTYGLAVEVFGANSAETDMLRRLRTIGAEPEVISKINFIAGATAEANLLSAIDRVTGQIPYRNDLYVRAGGGLVNSDLEICKEQPTGDPCASPLFIEGVNFGYFAGGAGHRFYATRWLTFRTEVRGRMILELIDGEMTPRSDVQINLGPTFIF